MIPNKIKLKKNRLLKFLELKLKYHQNPTKKKIHKNNGKET